MFRTNKMWFAFVISLFVVAGLGCNKGPMNDGTFAKKKLQAICNGRYRLHLNSEVGASLSVIKSKPSWVVRTFLTSDSLPANANTPNLDSAYKHIAAQSSGAAQPNTPEMLKTSINCSNLTATYSGPGISDPKGVTGLIKSLDDQSITITGATDKAVNSNGQVTTIPVEIKIEKPTKDPTASGADKIAYVNDKHDAQVYGIRTFKISVTQQTATAPRTLVYTQTITEATNPQVSVDANVLTRYLMMLPNSGNSDFAKARASILSALSGKVSAKTMNGNSVLVVTSNEPVKVNIDDLLKTVSLVTPPAPVAPAPAAPAAAGQTPAPAAQASAGKTPVPSPAPAAPSQSSGAQTQPATQPAATQRAQKPNAPTATAATVTTPAASATAPAAKASTAAPAKKI